MALKEWKSFNFFTVAPAKPSDEPEDAPPLFEGADVTCLTSGSDNLFLGTASGQIRVVNSSLKIVRSFPTHEHDQGGSVTHLKQVEGTSLLLSITEDLSSEPVLKVWALDKLEKKTGMPRCQSTLSINNKRKNYPISAFVATPSLSLLAVGFANGSVTLIKGDLVHDRGTKQRIIFESEEPITNLCFSPPDGYGLHGTRSYAHGADGGDTLYISTTARILTLGTAGKGTPARVLEPQGCGVGCMAPAVDYQSEERGLMRDSGDIVVVREDAIYFYGPNGRGACYPFEGAKQLIRVYKNYVTLVCPPSSRPSTAVGSRTNPLSRALKGLTGKNPATPVVDDLFDTTKFTILDTELKFVAHSDRLVSEVKDLFIAWDDLFLLTLDGKLHRYREVGLQEKLDILYARNLYGLALNLAQKAGVAEQKLRGIYRRRADYCYSRGEYDDAMQWYIKALGSSKQEEGVSTVIRKFLDTQRIHNLIEYLEELHNHDAATSDHTTLLLNCYAKLKDIDKLEKFIKSSSGEGLKFDVDTAILMCRQAGYYEQAVYLAEKQSEHEVVVGILVENLEKVEEALAYIQRLDPELAYQNLMKHTGIFLKKAPHQTTNFLVEYYSGQYVPRQARSVLESTASEQQQESGGGIQAYLNSSLLHQLPYVGTGATPTTSNTPSGPSPRFQGSQQDEATTEPLELPKQYKPPKPRTAFSSFVDHPKEFIVFLEKTLEATGERMKESDKIDIYTTLFEIYLQQANEAQDKTEKDTWEVKAKKIIESKEALIDTSNVLLLSHLADFKDGTTLVREKQGLRFDIFRSCCSAGDTKGAIRALKKYGAEEPQLYTAALLYFTSSPKILQEVGEEELRRVLKVIDDQGLMKPLQVVQTLSTNAVATVGMVKRYLGETIERERREIQNNRKMIETYRLETAKKRAEIQELGTKPSIFQAQRCMECSQPLELPTVHFLCKHSFHQRCVDPGDGGNLECTKCAASNQTIRTLRRSQDEYADRHDYFQKVLQDSKDKFGTISEFFGKGVMAVPPPMFN